MVPFLAHPVCFANLVWSVVRLYQTYIVPVVLYGCETWTTTKYLCARLDAFDMWALRKILRIPYTRHITNDEVQSRSNCLRIGEGPQGDPVTPGYVRWRQT